MRLISTKLEINSRTINLKRSIHTRIWESEERKEEIGGNYEMEYNLKRCLPFAFDSAD